MKMKRCTALGVACLALMGMRAWAQDASEPPAQQPPEAALQAVDMDVIVPSGTVIPIVLTSYLNSKSTQAGDTFYADTVYPVWIQQRLVIPKGSTIRGTVTEVKRPGRIRGKGRLAIRIDDVLLPNGIKRDLVAAFRGLHGPGEEKLDRKKESIEMGGSGAADTAQVAGPAGQGAIIGAISGGGKGAAVGAGMGAGVGLATVLLTRGRDVILDPGTQFDLELKQPLKFAYGEVAFSNEQLNNAQRPVANPRSGGRNARPDYGPMRRSWPWPYLR
jgi:hypothetical protein